MPHKFHPYLIMGTSNYESGKVEYGHFSKVKFKVEKSGGWMNIFDRECRGGGGGVNLIPWTALPQSKMCKVIQLKTFKYGGPT